MNRRMLSREDEASAENPDLDVSREDQDKINKFSRLHQKEGLLEEELKLKQKDKEDIEELSTELELADEDELVPYKIGDAFLNLPLEKAQSMLTANSEKLDLEVSDLESKLAEVREEMSSLKVALYARFGRSINLET